MPKVHIVSRRERELSVTCEDRPGTLSRLAKLLGAAKVNILATCCATAGVQGVVRILVDHVDRATRVLNGANLPFIEHAVLYVELPNMPGALADFSAKLAKAEINITSAYGSSPAASKKMVIVFRVSDLARALELQ